MNDTLKVIVVVLNYNGAIDTVNCIRSLFEAGIDDNSIVIVDNASHDNSVEIFKKEFPLVPLLVQGTNGGYSAGNNVGISYALQKNADFVLVINNDVTVEPDFLDHLLAHANNFPDVGVFNARVFFPNSKEIFSAAGRINKFLCTGQNKGAICVTKSKTDTLKKVDFVCGVLMLVRSKVFQEIGLLDEKYFMYFEDVEFSIRVSKKFEMMYVPDAIAYHKSGGGKGWRNYTEVYLYYHTRNRFLAFGQSSVLYKLYVVLFTTINSMAKGLMLSLNIFTQKAKAFKQLQSLWQGWRDGIVYYLHKNG